MRPGARPGAFPFEKNRAAAFIPTRRSGRRGCLASRHAIVGADPIDEAPDQFDQ